MKDGHASNVPAWENKTQELILFMGVPPTCPGIPCCSGIGGAILNGMYVDKGVIPAKLCDGSGLPSTFCEGGLSPLGTTGCSTLHAVGFPPFGAECFSPHGMLRALLVRRTYVRSMQKQDPRDVRTVAASECDKSLASYSTDSPIRYF